ncbi:hypothetical protein CEXT_133311 [Caerostris extrusa]|uniref:Transmembrane protein n=1 Tax=Caerostris extrusa TaxID=172846 RepID=A0AAV4YBV5_CAEEX|nr:hypothetical protein CEXT_133311 [Caerostris extrusa]
MKNIYRTALSHFHYTLFFRRKITFSVSYNGSPRLGPLSMHFCIFASLVIPAGVIWCWSPFFSPSFYSRLSFFLVSKKCNQWKRLRLVSCTRDRSEQTAKKRNDRAKGKSPDFPVNGLPDRQTGATQVAQSGTNPLLLSGTDGIQDE